MDKALKKLDHVMELWDKLDPRDRDIILKHAEFKVDTLCDWNKLTKEGREKVFRWFYL